MHATSCPRRLALALLALAGGACRPDFGLPVSAVTEPRILTVDVEPPEARPGDVVHLTAHPVSADGPLATPVDFAFCTSPRPLTENNVVSSECLGAAGQVVAIAGGVLQADATLPLDGCLLFGPETPPQKPGEPPFRARDPDVTGGYYQPVRVTLSGGVEAVALVRLRCNLPGASSQSAAEFGRRYTDNANPSFAGLALELDGAAVDPRAVPANATVTVRVWWEPSAAETFVVHERATDAIVPRREAIRVSWFTTAGLIPVVRTGRAEDDEGLDTSTAWQTPPAGSSGTLWAVMRDSRGGAAVRALAFAVR